VPFFRSLIAFSTFLLAALPYLRAGFFVFDRLVVARFVAMPIAASK
jgi:hypothetical protein